jgi:nucleoside-diphosphate-sugar epimerase
MVARMTISTSGSDAPAADAMRLFCFGYGYSAAALARALKGPTTHLAGTVREPDKAASLARGGVEALVFDGTAPLARADHALRGSTHLLISAPPDANGDPVLRHHRSDIVALSHVAPALRWVGYLSTTAVYGDHAGGWVDETTPVAPTSERARRRVDAEKAWLDLVRDGVPVHVFRLAGIYGPGRNALVDARRGESRRILKPGQVFSRVHVDDIAAVLAASIARPNPGAVYNVCDNEPAPGEAVVAYAYRLLGLEPPPAVPFEQAVSMMSEMARSFYADNKRVRNDRIKRELGVILRYPDYRAGLAALLAAGA